MAFENLQKRAGIIRASAPPVGVEVLGEDPVSSQLYSFPLITSVGERSYPALVALGDSITARANSTTSQFFAQTSVGYLSWALFLTGQRFYSPPSYNFGVNGGTARTVLSDQLPSALATSPDIAIVAVGTNDVANGESFGTITSTLTVIYDALEAAGAKIIAIPILARSGAEAFTSDESKVAARVNDFIRQCAYTRRGFYVADCSVVYGDPASSTGAERSGYADDNLHPNNVGAFAIGRRVADILDIALPGKWRIPTASALDLYDATLNPRGNLCSAGLLLGTGGTTTAPMTGDTATGWISAVGSLGGATAVAAKDTFADGRVAQKLTLSGTYTATGGKTHFQHQMTAANFAPGDVIVAECEIDVASLTNIISVDVFIQSTEGGTTYTHSSLREATVPQLANFAGVLRTYPRTITATPSSIYVIVQIQFKTPASALAIAGVIKFGSVAVRKVI